MYMYLLYIPCVCTFIFLISERQLPARIENGEEQVSVVQKNLAYCTTGRVGVPWFGGLVRGNSDSGVSWGSVVWESCTRE